MIFENLWATVICIRCKDIYRFLSQKRVLRSNKLEKPWGNFLTSRCSSLVSREGIQGAAFPKLY